MKQEHKANTNLLFVDGLRAIAAMYVVLHHGVMQYYGPNFHKLVGLEKFMVAILYQGRLAVDLFIVLSGYCLMLPVIRANYDLKSGAISFYKRRIIRILPPYYLAIVLSLILIYFFIGAKTGTHWDESLPVGLNDIVTHTFLIHDFFVRHASSINHSLWSVSVECRIYIFFPLLIYIWKRKNPLYTFLFVITASCSMYLGLSYLRKYSSDINLFMPGVDPYIILFFLGMFAAHIASWLNKSASKDYSITFLFILSAVGYAIVRILTEKFNVKPDSLLYQIQDVMFGLFCCTLLIACAINNRKQIWLRWFVRSLSWSPLAHLGTFAYSLYLIHAPLLQVISEYILTPLHLSKFISTITLLLLSIIVITPAAYMFFLLCERPFMIAGKRLTNKSLEKVAVINPAP